MKGCLNWHKFSETHLRIETFQNTTTWSSLTDIIDSREIFLNCNWHQRRVYFLNSPWDSWLVTKSLILNFNPIVEMICGCVWPGDVRVWAVISSWGQGWHWTGVECVEERGAAVLTCSHGHWLHSPPAPWPVVEETWSWDLSVWRQGEFINKHLDNVLETSGNGSCFFQSESFTRILHTILVFKE